MIKTRPGGGGDGKVTVTVTAAAMHNTVSPIMQNPGSDEEILQAATDGLGRAVFPCIDQSGGFLIVRYEAFGTPTTIDTIITGSDLANTNFRGGAIASDEDKYVYLGGGGRGVSAPMCSGVVRYDLSGTKTKLPSLALGRMLLAAACDGQKSVLFGGGEVYASTNTVHANVDKYDESGTRTSLTALSQGRAQLVATRLGPNKVVFMGGYWKSGGYSYHSDVVDCYDSSGTRTVLPTLSVARTDLAAATDGAGNAIAAGGFNTGAYLNSVDCYDPSGTRTTLDPLSQARRMSTAATNGNGDVLIGGGGTGNGDYTKAQSNVVDCYSKGVHTVLEPLKQGRIRPKAARNVDGSALFTGGYYYTSPSATTQATTTERYGIDRKAILIPAGNKYKFQEHNETQPAFQVDTAIVVQTPNVGFFKTAKAAITM